MFELGFIITRDGKSSPDVVYRSKPSTRTEPCQPQTEKKGRHSKWGRVRHPEQVYPGFSLCSQSSEASCLQLPQHEGFHRILTIRV